MAEIVEEVKTPDTNPLDLVMGKRSNQTGGDENSQAQSAEEKAETSEDQGGGVENPQESQQESQETQETQETQDTQDTQDTQETQDTQGDVQESDTKDQIPITQTEEYLKLKEDFDKLKTERDEYEAMLTEADPLQYFASEDEYKKQQILKNNPDLNASALGELFNMDIGAANPEDVLAMQLHLENPGFSFEEVRGEVLKKYDYDPGEGKAPFGLVAEANKARKSLKEIASQEAESPKDIKGVIDSKKKQYEEQIEKTKADFRPMVDKLTQEMTGIEKKDGKDTYLKYDFDPEYKSKISEGMMQYLVATGATLDNAEKSLTEARAAVEDTYILSNLKKIVKAHVDEAVSVNDNKWREKVHNPSPTNTQTAPETASKDTTVEDAFRMIKGKKG